MMHHILIVEDDIRLNRLYEKTLNHLALDVDAVFTVADAMASIQRQMPHLAIVDLQLPDGNGAEIVNHLKKQFGCQVHVIVVSGVLNLYKEQLPMSQIDYALLKPVSPRNLLALTRSVIEKIKPAAVTG